MKEAEIRPDDVFQEYLKLASEDGKTFFADAPVTDINCPACNSCGTFIFKKHGFSYQECPSCRTIFVSPRPVVQAFQHYYQNSPSARFFGTTFYKKTELARREKLWRPKAMTLLEDISKINSTYHEIIDIGGGHGIFAEEYQTISNSKVTVIEPGPESAGVCRSKGIRVVENFLECVSKSELPTGPKVFVCFELFEHLHDCRYFLSRLKSLMSHGDLFVFTTLSSLGADIQALWDDSNSISLQPLKFFNPKSIQILLNSTGYRVLKVSTPGQLDIDILQKNKTKIKDRFWRNLIEHSTPQQLNEWQAFLASSGYSSHMRVICSYS